MADAASSGFGTFLKCNKKEAIKLFTEHLQHQQDRKADYDSLLYRGISYGIIEEVSSAISDFTEAAKCGNPCQTMVADAHRLLYEGNTEAAINTIHQATQHYPLDPIGWHFYASFRNLSNVRDDETIAAFEKAIELRFPQAALSNYYLGEIMLLRNNDDAAVKYMMEAVRLSDTFAPAYLELGNTFAKLSRDKDAVHYYKKALELNSSLTQARNQLTAAHKRLGDHKSELQDMCTSVASDKREVRVEGDAAGGDAAGGWNEGNAAGGWNGSGRRKGGSNGGDDSDGGSGNNSDNSKGMEEYEKLVSIAKKCGKLYKKNKADTYVLTSLEIEKGAGEMELVITKDKAKHAGSQLKYYTVTRSKILFGGSLRFDEKEGKFRKIYKHESQEGTFIMWNDLKQVPR